MSSLKQQLEVYLNNRISQEIKTFGSLKTLPNSYVDDNTGEVKTRRLPSYSLSVHATAIQPIQELLDAQKGTNTYITATSNKKKFNVIAVNPSLYNADRGLVTLVEQVTVAPIEAFVPSMVEFDQ